VKTTREKVYEILQANPNQSLSQVGKQVGISGERVRQIQNKLGLIRISPNKPYQQAYCQVCVVEVSWKKTYCMKHAVRKKTTQLLTRNCPNCNKPTTGYKSALWRNTRTFCSNYCQGQFMGSRYGKSNLITYVQQQKTKTHCKRGHEFTPENTYIQTSKDGVTGRHCRACQKVRGKEHYARKKLALTSVAQQ